MRTEEKEEKEEKEEEEEKGNGSHCARDLASARVTLRVRLGVWGGVTPHTQSSNEGRDKKGRNTPTQRHQLR